MAISKLHLLRAVMAGWLFVSLPVRADYVYEPTDEAAMKQSLDDSVKFLGDAIWRGTNNCSFWDVKLKNADPMIGDAQLFPDFLVVPQYTYDPSGRRIRVALKVWFSQIRHIRLRYEAKMYKYDEVHLDLGAPLGMKCMPERGDVLFLDGAKRLADSFRRLVIEYDQKYSAAAESEFRDVATAYVTAATKPEFSEEARRFKVRAEAAIRDKRFNDAVNNIQEALKLAPWWPEGHFNLALILGELKSYESATREMGRYLMLVPNAANARAAKDKIYEWEDLLPKNGKSQLNPTQGAKSNAY